MANEALKANHDEMSLPALREDLSIENGGCFLNGAPSWLIYDPIRNQFFRIGELTFELLSIWKSLSLSDFAQIASRHLQRKIEPVEIEETAKFLFANQLTDEPTNESYMSFVEQEKARRKSLSSKIIHSYLFFRIPLFKPQKILDFFWPYVSFLFTKGAAITYVLLAVISLYLVSRQWQVFTSTFSSFLTFEGLALYGFSLVILKFLHEFGHAFVAKKYNVPVPIIGIAFLVLFPVLYTDTSAAVRLKTRRKRLMIDIAGILTELVVAVMATLFWVFLPDGPMRSIAFTMATLSWVLSLLVNLNPFLRFDGYYILSDTLGVENLQERSFAFAKWRMREILFNAKVKPPEVTAPKLGTLLVYYAWATWIYRFFLFLGIAFLVYSFFIKVIGIFLFVVEIFWFILLPIWRELKIWWSNRETSKTARTIISLLSIFVGLLLFFLPLSTKVEVPAVLKSSNEFHIYPPIDGKLVRSNLQELSAIKRNEILFEVASPKLIAELHISNKKKRLLETRLNRSTSSEVELSSITILKQELEAEVQKLKGLKEKEKSLVMRSPFDGVLVNVDRELHDGLWISHTRAVSILIDENSIKLSGLAKANAVDRMRVGQEGSFIPDGFISNAIPVKIKAISKIAEAQLNDEILAQQEGGLVPSTSNSEGLITPQGTWFKIELSIDTLPKDFHLNSVTRGLAVIEAEPQSYASRVFRQIASVLIRESGF